MSTPLSIKTNSLANNLNINLSKNVAKLHTSTERLASGLRIIEAADDADGLAVRELMRADIAATNQGIRNCMDAIFMLQNVDRALTIIDEKLIRMRELAEQAASGTYNKVQRAMINNEYMMMGSEITRIAESNEFNEIKLLSNKNKINKITNIENSNSESYSEIYAIDINYDFMISDYYVEGVGNDKVKDLGAAVYSKDQILESIPNSNDIDNTDLYGMDSATILLYFGRVFRCR